MLEIEKDNAIVFYTEDSFVSYLKFIIFNNYKYCKFFNRLNSENIINEEDFRLDIDYDSNKIIINFDFIFCDILKKLNNMVDNGINKIIINYAIQFTRVDFNCIAIFKNIIFNNKLIFSDVNFNDYVSFNNSKFNNFYIYSFSSKKLIDFRNIKIDEKLQISLSENNENTSISFYNLNFSNYNSTLNFNGKYYKFKELMIIDSIINGKINLTYTEVQKANFIHSTINSGVFNVIKFKVNNFANRESALFLKQQAIANNNSIDALQYHALEVVEHKKELLEKPDKTLKDYGDISSIYLSSLFSDNGLNWIKALMMTIATSSSFFMLSYLPNTLPILIYAILSSLYVLFYKTKRSYFFLCSLLIYLIFAIRLHYNTDLIMELFRFFNPTSFSQLDEKGYIYKAFNPLISGIFYFLGKVAFWYGSFHTVAAFRKFNRAL